MAIIFHGQFKGLADSKWSGIPESFSASVGIDGHSLPGAITVHQKLTKESVNTVTELCKVRVSCSNGYSFWFSSESGKIWARSSSGTWTLAYTSTAGAGGVNCLGASEFNGYIYWATESRVHRIAITDADDAWASITLNWATFAVTNSLYHPMAIQDLTLFIGDGHQVASVDDSAVFNNNALDILSPLIIKTITDFEIDLLIGTTTANPVNKTQLIRWDCVSPSWNTSDPIEEFGINAFIRDDNYMYVNAGRAGNIYYYNGEKLEPFKKIPGIYTNTSYGLINPHAVGSYKGLPIFGFSNGNGNPALQGVYTFGSYSKDYPKVMDLSWVISQNVTSNVEIGAILVIDFDILVAWKSGGAVGVDKIDYSAKYTSAYFETVKIDQAQRDLLKTFKEISTFYDSLPSGTGITFYYNVNSAGYVAMDSVTDTDLARVYAQLSVPEVASLQFKVAFIVNVNDAPVIEAVGMEIQ